jgi:2-polyprenyl-3-methyl-5-hydroxy-6-metoxy-1,4-benzoquinol methylase
MTDFDYQWKHVMEKDDLFNGDLSIVKKVLKILKNEKLTDAGDKFECNKNRVKEFLQFTGIKPWHKKDLFIKGKNCLDAGCGPGRWTCAMQRMGAKKVDSFDLSEQAVKRCQQVNPSAHVFDIWNLKPNPVYDFVLSWGVLHHTKNTREAFSKVASQVKKDGMLHVMIYNKENDWAYEGFRGETCLEKHKYWVTLTDEEKIDLCKKMVKKYNGNIHGWFDALNPTFNWSHSANEVKQWFEEEGFSEIKLKMVKQNINMSGILK